MKEAAVKVKHKTKSSILGMFRHGGKKAAGARGDVSVDGKGKRVSLFFSGDMLDTSTRTRLLRMMAEPSVDRNKD